MVEFFFYLSALAFLWLLAEMNTDRHNVHVYSGIGGAIGAFVGYFGHVWSMGGVVWLTVMAAIGAYIGYRVGDREFPDDEE